MRKWILAVALLLPSLVFGQLAQSSQTFSATGSSNGVNLSGTVVNLHKIYWRTQGTVSTCTVALDSSTDGVSWSAGGVIAGQTCTAAGSSAVALLVTNFVRITVTTLTGGGSVFITYGGNSDIVNSALAPGSTGGVAIVQDVNRDTNNTTTAQLGSGATFTGGCTSTLGISSYQVNIVTDQPSTLQVDQFKSPTCTGTPDNTSSLTVPASTPTSPLTAITYQMTNENVRLRFTNNGAGATTTLSVTAELCPLCVFQTPFPPITSSTFTGSPLNVGAPITEKGGRWAINNSGTAGSGVQGTTSRAAGGVGVRHVIDCFGFSADSAAAIVATNVLVSVRDGATGAGAIIWQFALSFPTASALGVQEIPTNLFCGLNIIGTANTAMTVEFSAAVAGSIQSVNATGYDVH